MRFFSTILSLGPVFANAVSLPIMTIDQDDVHVITPSIEELHRAYPGINFTENSLQTREVGSIDATEQRTLGYKFVAGGLTAIGYFSIGAGCNKFIQAKNACSEGSNTTTGDCILRCIETGLAHGIVASAGFVGGRQFIHYFWHGGALQAAGVPPANGRMARRACNTDQKAFASPIRFQGDYGFKISSKDFCYKPDSGQLGYVSALSSMIYQGMDKNCALDTQFTIYKTSNNLVLARSHAELETVRTDVCPFDISGGDSCTV